MNKNKLTLEIDDTPIIERVIRAVKGSYVEDILVIYRQREIRKIAEKNNVKAIYNVYASQGQSEAIKLGIRAADPQSKGYMFFVGDQPFLKANTINQLIEAFNKAPQTITLPLYNGKRGNPVIFPIDFKDALLGITGDQGGRGIIEQEKKVNCITIEDSRIGIDIDTWQQYEKLYGGDEINEKKYSGD